MATKSKPSCDRAFAFLKARLGKHCLAPCTGQDYIALAAWFHLVDLWGSGDYAGEAAAVHALAHVLDGMQRSVWPLAKAGIPGVLDWSHEERLWSLVQARRESPPPRVPPLQGGDGATGMSRLPAGRS